MCMSSKAPKDNSAEIARQAENERQARIAEGQSSIDSAFNGFNDDFYNNYQTTYSDYYTPQITDQYSDAVKRLTLQLAQSGNLTGSVGATQLADLKKTYDTQSLALTNQGLDATNQLRQSVDARKSQLYTDNRASADPGNAASAAASAAQYLQPTAPTSPLANVFSDFFAQLGNNAAIKAQQSYGNTGVQSYGSSNGGSVNVVNR